MTLRETIAQEVLKLLETKTPKEVCDITGLNLPEVQNIVRNGTPNLRYVTLVNAAERLHIRVDEYLVHSDILGRGHKITELL